MEAAPIGPKFQRSLDIIALIVSIIGHDTIGLQSKGRPSNGLSNAVIRLKDSALILCMLL